MRQRLILAGTVATLALAFASTPSSRAQQGCNSSGDEGGKKSMTIRGVVAEITAEGEFIVDYRHNRAVEAEAAFLTVVGSPKDVKGGHEQASHHVGKRDNVYIVWMTPKTKVCKCAGGEKGEKQAAATGSEKPEKKECSMDQLEVGDHVEIQFTPRDKSDKDHVAHQNEKIRQKHGRHRTHVGYASEVTIEEHEGGHKESGSEHKGGSGQ